MLDRLSPVALSSPQAASRATHTTPDDLRFELQRLFEDGRWLIGLLPDGEAKRDVHEGWRVEAATCGLTLKVRKTGDTLDGMALVLEIGRLHDAIEQRTKGRLVERRNWIFQNAQALVTEGLSTLRRACAPPPVKHGPRK